MNQNQRQQSNKITRESLGELTQKEVELLYWIRNRFRWGELIIEVRDGYPFRIRKAIEFQTLE